MLFQDNIINDGISPEAELHAAINPLNPNNIVLATMHGFDNPDGSKLKVYYTKDGGNTWELSGFEGFHTNDSSGAGDPVLAFDKDGNAILVNLFLIEVPNFPLCLQINLVSKSIDGGNTWSKVAEFGDFIDKPWLGIDTFDNSPNAGNVYIPYVATEVFLQILDSNFQLTSTITLSDGNQLPSVVVKKDGIVFSSTIEDNIGPEASLFVQEYSNGGTNLVHSTKITSFPDGFSKPNVFHNRFQHTPYLAIDNSGGQYDGRLYMSYTASETNHPNFFDIFLTYSDDNGVTWSTPKVVHNDGQEEVHQFYSSIYVNENGILLLDWYDQRNHSNTSNLTDFYIGISYDGGDTFIEKQLNSISSDFDFAKPSGGGFGIGEYHQLVATKKEAISFWSDGRTNDNDLNIYMAKVDISNPLNVNEYSVVSNAIGISSLYPQPAKTKVSFRISLQKTTELKYEIFNALGQKVQENNWKRYNAGKHQLTIDLNKISSGNYFITIKNKTGYFKTQKIIKS